ncbi:unnamed protein product [Medioppia subpectinata]|uniref:Lethal giant larvae homologue 2 domain-containing protein n=1 Tax=Medioppia subpectinata TaxID=1979941 RepID=A0A7R9KJE5_9ACAR|nr:unnamed protein product [Medioppia subpectinata]CAG2104589.1 unnamed protein product [Medioppia subpectinata]
MYGILNNRSRKAHPGAVVHLSDCPIDSNKLLLGFESGCIVLWDLRNKSADYRIYYSEGLKSISWHHEGRQFIASHTDGSITTWGVKGGNKPVTTLYPHSKSGNDLKPELCKPIYKAEWRTVRNGEPYIIFSGGLPVGNSTSVGAGNQASSSQSPQPIPQSLSSKSLDKTNGSQSLTVMHGKSITVLEMEDNIIDFITLCETAYETDFSDPYAIVVLLHNDLVVVDLLSPGYPCFQNPYSMDLHESPVTYCYYLADCPTDLVYAFLTVGHKSNKRSGFSEREWPINGGEWGSSTCSYPELIITGHADGSIKFWDASSVHLHQLYKLKTAKLFEKPKINKSGGDSSSGTESGVGLQESDDPFAIEQLTFCTESRYLCIGGASSQVIGFRFSKHETHSEVPQNQYFSNHLL